MRWARRHGGFVVLAFVTMRFDANDHILDSAPSPKLRQRKWCGSDLGSLEDAHAQSQRIFRI